MLYGERLWQYKDKLGNSLETSYNRVFNNGVVGSISLNNAQVIYLDNDEIEVDFWNGDLEIYFDDGSEYEREISVERFSEAFENRFSNRDYNLFLNLYLKNGKIYHNSILQDYSEVVVKLNFWWQYDIEINPGSLILYIRNFMSKGGYVIRCSDQISYKILCDYFCCIDEVYNDDTYRVLELQRNKDKPTIIDNLDEIDNMEGHDFEYYCARLLISKGFRNVEVTKASGDQGADIIAEKDNIRYAIQCKKYSSVIGNTPIQEVNAAKVFYKCHVGVVMTNSTFTSSAIELAKATGTLLWDREYFAKLL